MCVRKVLCQIDVFVSPVLFSILSLVLLFGQAWSSWRWEQMELIGDICYILTQSYYKRKPYVCVCASMRRHLH